MLAESAAAKDPILLGFSTRDIVVTQDDVSELYDLYQGDKFIYEFSSTACIEIDLHPEDRQEKFVRTALKFISFEAKEKYLWPLYANT